jgi:hypothetical protein
MVFIVVSRRFASDKSKGHAAAIEWLGAGFNRARAVLSLARGTHSGQAVAQPGLARAALATSDTRR